MGSGHETTLAVPVVVVVVNFFFFDRYAASLHKVGFHAGPVYS